MVFPLSGFTAFPNPYMVPFMGMQSWVIGIMFGMAYQGGKRLISKMDNKEFNALDLNKFGFDQMHKILKQVPQMEAMFAEMRPMVQIMASEFRNLIESIPDLAGTIIGLQGQQPPPVAGAGAQIPLTAGAGFVGGGAKIAIKNLENQLARQKIDFQKQWQEFLRKQAKEVIITGTTPSRIKPKSFQVPVKRISPTLKTAFRKVAINRKPIIKLSARNIKRRAPKSILILERKLLAQIKALKILPTRRGFRGSASGLRTAINSINRQISILHNKYTGFPRRPFGT